MQVINLGALGGGSGAGGGSGGGGSGGYPFSQRHCWQNESSARASSARTAPDGRTYR